MHKMILKTNFIYYNIVTLFGNQFKLANKWNAHEITPGLEPVSFTP